MKENKSNTILNQYLREKKLYCYYELKVAKGLYFYFRNIETNQDEGLPALQNNGLTWKFSDEDSRKKPCDGGCFPPLPAYLVIKFGTKFYFMKYKHITKFKDQGHKSIDENTCAALADLVVHM